MKWVAQHPRIWWGLWAVALLVGAGLVAFLWYSDSQESDRIALVAVAMSVVGLVIAAFALRWTRETVLIADRTLRAQVLSEDMQRLELIAGAIRDGATSTSPTDAAKRLGTALGPFTGTDLPRTVDLWRQWHENRLPDDSSINLARKEVADLLDALRLARASLTPR
jgi:phosphate/sulfate permease